MAINNSGQWAYVLPTGQAIFVSLGDSPPSGSTVLVCPGGTLSDDLAARYKVTDRLKGSGDPPAPRDPAGNPIVVRDGKAYAASVLAEDDPARKAAEDAAKAEDEAGAAKARKAATAKAEAKAKAVEAQVAEDAADDADDEPEPALKVKADAQSKAVHPSDAGVEDKAVHPARRPAKPAPKGK